MILPWGATPASLALVCPGPHLFVSCSSLSLAEVCREIKTTDKIEKPAGSHLCSPGYVLWNLLCELDIRHQQLRKVLKLLPDR